MVFSSSLFLFFFIPIFFSIYFLTKKNYRNIIALLGSMFFYFWGGSTFILILTVSLLIDWHVANIIHKEKNEELKKFFFIAIIVLDVFLLVYFKYSNFFFENFNKVLSKLHFLPIQWTNVLLPIGISFIVFHKISYMIEIYKDSKKPTEKISDYFLYIMLFPMAIAGPILKYNDIADQLIDRDSKFEDILYGLFRFSIGMAKKVLLADNVAFMADRVFSIQPQHIGVLFSWLGILCYALQIYFDFSGYADMAIGLSRIMGFKIAENFNMPYISQNISEFWKRWHISLTNWMRSYIYIPLGGNRCSKARNYFNLWVVFLISGFWHGANWTFIVWGIIHGVYILIDKLFWIDFSKKLPKGVNIAITYFLVLIAWVFFRSESFTYALGYIQSMFNFHLLIGKDVILSQNKPVFYISNVIITATIVSLCITFLPAFKVFETLKSKYLKVISSESFMMISTILLLSISITVCVSSSFSPFIYFRF